MNTTTAIAARDDAELTLDDLYATARINFGIFLELVFGVLHPGRKLDYAPYLDVLIALMESAGARRKRRIIVNLPPGFMKSMIISIMYVAWQLGVDPSQKFVCISYGDDLANKHSASTRKLMQSPIYRAIFPATVLDKKAENWLQTTKGGYRYATAINSDITGFRPNQIIVDDPIEPKEATSATAKEKIRSWLSESVMTRFEDNDDNVFILVMHRVAPDDIAGTLSRNDGYFTLALPLVAEKAEVFRLGREIVKLRQPGDLLHPGRMTRDQLEQLRNEVAPHAFDAQYQQRPRFGGSRLCSIDRLARYHKVPEFTHRIHSWDIGATVEGNPTICTSWGLAKGETGQPTLFLTDVVKLKCQLPDVRAAIELRDKVDRPDLIILDHRGVGLGIYQGFERAGWRHVKALSDEGRTNESKIDRFGQALLPLYDGLACFPEQAPFMDEVLQALSAFPDLKEFDLVDSITQLLAYRERALFFLSMNLRSQR